jgi:predicted transposase YdaD
MFAAFDNYDVQETRRVAKKEGRQEGLQEGREEGRMETITAQIRKKLEKGSGLVEIAEMLEIELDKVAIIADLIQSNPEASDSAIAEQAIKSS